MAKQHPAAGEENEPNIYEFGFLLSPNIAEEALAGSVAALKERFEKRGAAFISEEFPKKIGLAYPIVAARDGAKVRFGTAYLGALKYQVPPQEAAALHGECAADPALLRFLLVRTVRESAAPRRAPAFLKPEAPRSAEPSAPRKAEKPSMTTEELDRTIEELVIE